jgi:hypothetical protein
MSVYQEILKSDIERYDGETVTLNKLAAYQAKYHHTSLSIPQEIIKHTLPAYIDEVDPEIVKLMEEPPQHQRRII